MKVDCWVWPVWIHSTRLEWKEMNIFKNIFLFYLYYLFILAMLGIFTWLPNRLPSEREISLFVRYYVLSLPQISVLRKAMTNRDGILKSRDITLPTKICIVKAMVCPVIMYRCESWTPLTPKKAEHWRIDAFKLWCWIIFLRVPWAARRTNQSILKEINPSSIH